jgi:hypothetical protein
LVESKRRSRSTFPPSHIRFPLEFIEILVTLGFVGNPRRLGSSGSIQAVDLLLNKFVKVWRLPQSLPQVKGLFLLGIGSEKKVSLRGVGKSFVGSHTSPT